MVEISLSGSGEGPGWETAPGYSTTCRVALVAGVDAIERQGVEVHVQVQGRAEALNEGDGATLATPRAPENPA